MWSVVDRVRRHARILRGGRENEPWTPAENRLLRRWVRKFRPWRRRSIMAAARELQRELARLPKSQRPARARTLKAVYVNLRMARARAVGPARVLWDPAELRLVDRFAARYNQGIYPDFITASLACLPALEDVRHRILRRNPDHPLARYSRHLGGVAYRLRIQALKQKAE